MQARALRAGLSVAARQAASAEIERRVLTMPELAALPRWFVYVSYRNEVETHGLIQLLLARGAEVFVPLLIENEGMAAARLEHWQDLSPGKHGILTVAGPQISQAESVDVAIVPGLAFTTRGERLGYGRGNYDRFFARHRVTWKVGLAFSCQIVGNVAGEPHDVPMDLVVTEREVWSRDLGLGAGG
jgi:5-formyltetrahydrofolate cyclo-ligase